MSQVLHGQATATQLGGPIQKAAMEVAQHPVLRQEAPVMQHALALAQSVLQLVKLEQPAPTPVQQQPLSAAQKALQSQPKGPVPKRRGPKM